MRSGDACRLLRLESRVGEVRARRCLERDRHLRAIVLGEEPDADRAHRGHGAYQHHGHDETGDGNGTANDRVNPRSSEGVGDDHDADDGARETRHSFRRQDERGNERAGSDRDHRRTVIQRPGDDLLVILRLTIEPMIESIEEFRDA